MKKDKQKESINVVEQERQERARPREANMVRRGESVSPPSPDQFRV